jgi:hypothetical protein
MLKEEAGRSKEWSVAKLLELANTEDGNLREKKFIEYKAKINNKSIDEIVCAEGEKTRTEDEDIVSVANQKNEGSKDNHKTSRNNVVTVNKMKVRLASCVNFLKKIKKHKVLPESTIIEIDQRFLETIKIIQQFSDS